MLGKVLSLRMLGDFAFFFPRCWPTSGTGAVQGSSPHIMGLATSCFHSGPVDGVLGQQTGL